MNSANSLPVIDNRPAADKLAARMRRDRIVGEALSVCMESSPENAQTGIVEHFLIVWTGIFVDGKMIASYSERNGRVSVELPTKSIGHFSPRNYRMF